MGEVQEFAPIMLYDGVCGFCNRSVQTILNSDKRGTLRFAALQSDFGKSFMERHPDMKDVDSVVWLETAPATGEERVFIRSTAALHIAAYLGGIWRLCLIAYVIPSPIRNFFYDLFARYRYKFFGKYDSCMLPPPEVRARFLDAG